MLTGTKLTNTEFWTRHTISPFTDKGSPGVSLCAHVHVRIHPCEALKSERTCTHSCARMGSLSVTTGCTTAVRDVRESMWSAVLSWFSPSKLIHPLTTRNPASGQNLMPDQSEWLQSKSLQVINAGEGVEKREPSYTVGGNAN